MDIDVALARALIAEQFPAWADLPIHPVEHDGHDNRTFRLGSEMSVRIPSHQRYVAQVEKEQLWLPRLARFLPVPIPAPLAMGTPSGRYPWHWSIYQWLDGENATTGRIQDARELAATLTQFLRALQQVDPTGGPPPGPHNFFRGGPLTVYDAETRDAITVLRGEIDPGALTAVWEAALGAEWHGKSVWLHGDVSASNLLVRQGRLCAVIDFGCSGVGDPACDLTIAWTLFSGESRSAFREGLPLDDAAWARARGWALWKGLITLAEDLRNVRPLSSQVRRVIDDVIAEHVSTGLTR
jgi:aminoglycoside phosphotransferase (APT) family kinase protein